MIARQTIDEWERGLVSAPVLLARLVLSGAAEHEIAAMLPADSELARFFQSHREGVRRVSDMLRGSAVTHDASGKGADLMVADIAAMFDRAVAISPEASVAAYSLGNRAIIDDATAEIVAWLEAQSLVSADDRVLDFGCGYGRISNALAPRVASLLGLDISAGMIAEAQRRFAAPNLAFERNDGIAALPPANVDLILAVDSFPYLVQAGLAEAQMAAFELALRAGGRLAIFNLSYRETDLDIADAKRWAAEFGLAIKHCGERPFRLWDGVVFVFAKSAG